MSPKGMIDEELIDLLIDKAEKNLLRPEAIPTLLHVVSMLYAKYLAQAKNSRKIPPEEIANLRRLFNNMVETIMDKPEGTAYDDILLKITQTKAPKWAREEDFE